jgi:Protein of unknown function (DUF2946)
MDEIVKAAMAKWPQVPHCYGWLALDARGNWYMRDDRTQAAGPFPQVKGSRIQHDKLLAFIERNYASDERGAWYFQNGPQRVYVQLEAAPYVWRVTDGPDWPLHSHTGLTAHFKSAWLCEAGRLYLDTDIGFGLVHTMDMVVAAQAVASRTWGLTERPFAQMPARFGYVLQPRPDGAG